MKSEKLKDNKYFQIGLTAFLVIAASIITVFIVFKINEVGVFFRKILALFIPFIVGFIFAYLLNPVVKFFKKNIVGKWIKGNDKAVNNLSILITCLIFVFILILLFSIIIPDLLKSIEALLINLPSYFEKIKDYLLKKFSSADSQSFVENNYAAINEYINNVINKSILPKVELWLTTLSSGVVGAVKTVFDIFLGFVIAIYYLIDKDSFIAGTKRIVYCIFPIKISNKIMENTRHTNEIFSNFIMGKILDSLIIGFITFTFLALFGFPYALLIGVIVGVTNIIPYFGPFIGAIPSALLILLHDPAKCLIFIIFIIALQQIDGYLIGPKLCGSKTGLKSFWVLASITFFGNLFGVVGMLLGVPLFALIYGYLDNRLTTILKEKELPIKNEDYFDLERINAQTKKIVKKD